MAIFDLPMMGAMGMPDQTSYFPAAPAQSRPGSLGGLGGLLNSNLATGIGLSLLSSPRQAPLSGLGQILPALNEQTQKQTATLAQQRAISSALQQAGASQAEADRLAASPAAAELWLKQKLSADTLASNNSFNSALSDLYSGTGGAANVPDVPTSNYAPSASPAPSGMPTFGSNPALFDNRGGGLRSNMPVPPSSGSLGGLGGAPRLSAGGMVSPDPLLTPLPASVPRIGETGPAPARPAASPIAATPNALDGLMQKRRGLLQLATRAKTDDQRANLKALVDGVDAEIKFTQDRMPKPTDDQRELVEINQQRASAGLPELRLDEWVLVKSRSGASNTTIDMKGPSEYDKVWNGELAKRAIALEDDATSARKSIGTLKGMERAMADPGFYSGAGSNTVTSLKRVANSLGLPGADGIASIEQFNALAKDAALSAMGGSLGAGFSNADRSFVEEQVPVLTNTPEGNRALITIQRKMAERKIEIAKLAREYTKGNDGRLDSGFYDEVTEWAEANPLFADMAPAGTQERGAGGIATGATATNPQTGEKIQWDGSTWVPAQ